MSDNISINKPINSLNTNQPLDIRTLVNTYSDIQYIPNPYIGMTITVKVDETNNNKMTDYKVKSLKSNELGMTNTVIDEIERLDVYIGMNNLEDKVNTLVGISADNQAVTVRDSIPSGFIQLGELDYDYMLENENKIKLKSTSIAYVNGYKVGIVKDTIIDIGRAPEKETREDLIFLEAWKDEEFPITGKLAWRIRHVAGVDFDMNYDGLDYYADSTGKNYPSKAKPQGGNSEPLSQYNNDYGCNFFKSAYINPKHYYVSGREKINDDIGLYVAGDGNASRKELFKTLDGYVYAIPMFRLYRKPSCGKAIPFEYSKFNPKCDYNKFRKLIKEEKVERVINENIKGRSLVNLAYQTPITLTKNLYSPLTYDGLIKSNKEYTLSFNISKITGSSTGKFLRLIIRFTEGSDDTSSDVNINVTSSSFTTGKVKVKIPSQTDIIAKLYIHLSGGTDGDSIALTDVMILEDDWTNKEIPEFFTGLKSLGEDDNNLIAIKNGILDKDTYDINDGNQKLNTFEDVTYISSDNTIKPTVEAVIKNGEEETPLDSLNTKLETTGQEIIEFTKIKGKTIQNLLPDCEIGNVGLTTFFINDINKQHERMLKPNTLYTMKVFPSSSKIDRVYLIQGATNLISLDINNMAVFTTVNDLTSVGSNFIHFYTKSDATLEEVKDTKIMLLEGNWTDKEIPSYIEGIKSVGENKINLTTTGKNLFDGKLQRGYWYNGSLKPSEYSVANINNTRVKPNTHYTVTIENYNGKIYIAELNSYGDELYTHTINSGQSILIDKGNFIKFCTDHSYNLKINLDTRIQIEEGTLSTTYKSYSVYTQNIYLKEPLRSLPNGVCDEIVGNKIIKRVGKVIIDGTKGSFSIHDSTNDTIVGFTSENFVNSNKKQVENLLCDKFCGIDDINIQNKEGILVSEVGRVYIRIKKSKLSELTSNAIKQWLQENPTTVYYELANPIEEYIEQVYDKESIKTYQLDAPLRSLPNGIKDEIKDGTLTRRLGEILLDNQTEYEWGNDNSNNYVYIKNFKNTIKPNSTLVSDKLPYYKPMPQLGINYLTISSASVIAFMFDNPVNTLEEGITKAKNLIGNSGMKIIYELNNPIEIPLVESNCQSVDYSLNRQFKERNYLRELPNGTKDTIENGKVVRRTKKMVLNGSDSEDWWGYQPHETGLKRVIITLNDLKLGSLVLCKKFKNVLWNDNAWESTVPTVSVLNSHNHMYFFVNNINSIDEWTARLQQSPIEIIYELDTPIEEELTTENCNYYHYHDINTYCGSMYLGNGRNYIINDNKLPSDDDSIILDTGFREIVGNTNIEDCRYRKSDYGYDNLYLKPIGNNLVLLKNLMHVSLTEVPGNLWSQKGSIEYDSAGNISWYNDDGYEWSDMGVILAVKSNTKYTFGINIVDNKESQYNLVVAEYSKKPVIDVGEANVDYYLGVKKLGGSSSTGVKIFTFTTNSNTKYIYCTLSVKNRYAIYKLSDFIVNEGDPIDFELGTSECVAFENIEENDIDDLRHQVSLTGFSYPEILQNSFNKLLKGEL